MPTHNVTTVRKSTDTPIYGDVQLVQGANVTLTQSGQQITIAASGGGGSANVGTKAIDFGAFPGSSHASVTITGQAGILSSSVVQAWISPIATADHTADEAMLETIKVCVSDIVAGTGFTIHAFNSSQLNEPLTEYGQGRNHLSKGTAAANTGFGANTLKASVGGKGTRIYGEFNVNWQWA